MSDLISRSEFLKEIEKYKFGAISNDAKREYIKKLFWILSYVSQPPMMLTMLLRNWKRNWKKGI